MHASHEEAVSPAVISQAETALRENAQVKGTGVQFRPAADQWSG
jgi:hypothetical protein